MNENENENENTKWLVKFEQGAKGLASMMRSYYKELINEGFNDDQAMRLISEYQNVLIETSYRGGAEEP